MSVLLKKVREMLIEESNRTADTAVEGDSIACESYGFATVFLNIGAAAGTPEALALDFKLQGSIDGINFVDITGGAFSQQTSASQLVLLKNVDIFGFAHIRPVYTLAFTNGTDPDLTFGATIVFGQMQSATFNVSATGVATATKQSDGSQKTKVVDGSGNIIGATANALDVNIKSGIQSGMTAAEVVTTNATNHTASKGVWIGTTQSIDLYIGSAWVTFAGATAGQLLPIVATGARKTAAGAAPTAGDIIFLS